MEQILLIQGVRHVSEIASPLDPRLASQRAFDEARPRSDFPDLPRARNIARSLDMSWADVLILAHEPESVHAHRLGRKRTQVIEDYLTPEYVAYVLKLVALRLRTRTLSISDYSTERAVMLKADRARWLHGGQLIIPNEDQVITVLGPWDEALVSADLEAPRDERGITRKEQMRAPSLVDLLERFHTYYSVQPTMRDLQAFALANGIPFPDMHKVRFGDALAQWKAGRSEQGLPVPSVPPPPSERADYTRDVGAALPGEKRRAMLNSLDECVAWMCQYLEELPASAHSTRASYRNWARANGAPSPSVLDRNHGGFSRVRRLAQERIRAEYLAEHSRPAA